MDFIQLYRIIRENAWIFLIYLTVIGQLILKFLLLQGVKLRILRVSSYSVKVVLLSVYKERLKKYA